MKTYEGVVKLMGTGVMGTVNFVRVRFMTVFEIGENELKNVKLPIILENYVDVGEYRKVLIGKNTIYGILSNGQTVYGVKRDERIYTAGKFSGFTEFFFLLVPFAIAASVYSFTRNPEGSGWATLIFLILVVLSFRKGYNKYKAISNFGKE